MLIKKGFLLILFFLLFPSLILAQNESKEGLESFEFPLEEVVEISPPPPPETDLEKLQKFDLLLILKDYNTKNLIKDIHVTIEIYDRTNNKETKTIQYVGEDGLLKIRLEQGSWDITLKVDELTTPGKDYFFTSNYNVDRDLGRTVYLLSVGSVKGVVYDRSDNVVRNANLKFECGAGYGETDEKSSDNYGSFTSYWLPAGSCRVSAIYGNRIGYREVEISKGSLESVDIILNKSLKNYNTAFLAAVLIIIILVLLYFYKKPLKKAPKKEEEEPGTEEKTEKEEEKELSHREKDILETLKEREKDVVNFLLENENHSTQANIKNSTGIPKTTLVRTFQSLETKNIIKVEKIGKMKKISLTGWFLGKE